MKLEFYHFKCWCQLKTVSCSKSYFHLLVGEQGATDIESGLTEEVIIRRGSCKKNFGLKLSSLNIGQKFIGIHIFCSNS